MISSFLRYARRLERSVESSRSYARLIFLVERRAMRASQTTSGGPSLSLPRLVVLASEGRGNIGDQAMLEAVTSRWDGPIIVIADQRGAVQRGWAHPRVKVEVIDGYLSRRILCRSSSSRRFWNVVRGANALVVIGADVMDGVYSPRVSTLRATVSALAAEMGIDSRVVGFSWSGSATAGAGHALSRAVSAGVRVYPRDPVSFARLSETLTPTALSADVVFNERVTSTPQELEDALASGRPLALINASGLIAQTVDLRRDYSELVNALTQRGFMPVLVPHVLRQGDDDLALLREVWNDSERVAYLIERQLRPAEVRSLAQRAHLVVTGRMHLAVMAMSVGTVAFTLSTVGKVEGLYDLLQSPGLVLRPTPGFAETVVTALDSENLECIAERLRSNLPGIRRLSSINFDGWSPAQ